ncbi:hypothetical protein MSPP1_001762 [Malassezia sp. CBS 17886]|nr:hypothetical protein MSPP1_001762 [Malassezia sp. CBS 17886]
MAAPTDTATAERPREKVPIPDTDGWLRVTTTLGNVFYAQKKTKRSEWTVPEEIAAQVAEMERAAKRPRREAEERTDGGVDGIAPPPAVSLEEGRALFLTMLTSLNGTAGEVNPMAPWDTELRKFVHLPAYSALPSSRDREEVFNEWCKLRLREKRAGRQDAPPPGGARAGDADADAALRAFLKKRVLSTRLPYEAFDAECGADPRVKAVVRVSGEARVRELFEMWQRDLGERKRALAAEAEDAFRALLSERLSRTAWQSPEQWAVAKRTEGLAEDPRYDAVGSATRRAALFGEWRTEQVLRDKEQLAGRNRAARQDVEHEERENDFRQLLVDAVRDPWLAWDDATRQLAKDARYAPANGMRDTLPEHAKRTFFEEHIAHLQAKRREQLARLFARHARDADGVPQLDVDTDAVLARVRAEADFAASGLQRFVGEDAGVHRTRTTTLQREFEEWDTWRKERARAEFHEMLQENAFVDFWGRMRKEKEQQRGEGDMAAPAPEDQDEDEAGVSVLDMASQLDLREIESVLQWIQDHLRGMTVQKTTVHQHHIA